MSIADGMVPELQHETATTKTLLERVPADKLDWQPHEKSFSLGHLAAHVVETLGWVRETVDVDVFEMDPESYVPWQPDSLDEILAKFDEHVAMAAEKIGACSDEAMMANWTMKVAGREFITLPRVAVIRGFIMNHLIHHRGQLTVYLRMLDVALPQIYGPTADEPGMTQNV
jgi:uncharacterized damage-inducible protein DinB